VFKDFSLCITGLFGSEYGELAKEREELHHFELNTSILIQNGLVIIRKLYFFATLFI